MRKLTLLNEIFGKLGVIKRFSGEDDGVFGLEGLQENVINIGVTASDATDDLSYELEGAFLGGVVR